ncbi:CD2 antigen cytoplasmic tail-binding protein 2 homolog [Lytechinus pictus]|uniref:CD2 antigen cytoplasmic tail-binding protein 2 homolog n=1 Tax=Lytechinus pictus TaxID=7653 RepID=UPI00240E0542|nr:CD2 antigen cytoplasmic tail-binding protein 2 homolog [Lytechinus pictus]XP_054749467.1 CD2 antigen cytoplasmic tail-binding protein 2 homolog [Lytechinus pictus]
MAEKMKRNVTFAKQEEQGDGGPSESKRIKTFKEKHSLDSDEEDKVDEVAAYQMHEEEVEGAEDDEDGIAESDDDIKITPFNLKQEMSEGHFDKDGNYHEKKGDDVRDEWLENIDWERLEEENAMKRRADKGEEADDEDEGDAKVVRPELEVMRLMLGFMKEGESVTKAMQRLGGGKKRMGSAAQRKFKNDSDSSNKVTAESKADMLKLTDLVDELVARGQFDMYQYTYEKIQHKLKQDEDAQAAKKDAEFDMFAEEVDEKKLTTNTKKEDESSSMGKSELDPDKVYWEYKWENQEDADVYGPYESEQMENWTNQDYFKDGVWVRKVGSGQNFYTSKRIDFSLYV